MDQSVFIEGLVVGGIYLLFRFLEMRFVLKESKPLKTLLRDTLVVYISFIDQFGSIKSFKSIPEVFTNKPDF